MLRGPGWPGTRAVCRPAGSAPDGVPACRGFAVAWLTGGMSAMKVLESGVPAMVQAPEVFGDE